MEEKRVASKAPKKPSEVKLNPKDELSFAVGTANGDQVSSKLTIMNPTNEVMCFKVKTTAPKEYCVRPNSGKLSPGASIDINVMLQPPMPKEGTKSKDKFLVQTVYEKEVEDSNHPDMWKTVPKSMIMEDKLKCNWSFGAAPAAAKPPAAAAAAKPSPVPAPAPASEEPKTSTAAAYGGGVPAAAKPAAKAAEPSSPLRKVAGTTEKPKPKPKEKEATSSTPPAAAVARATPVAAPTEMPSLLLLLGVFMLGYIFGKFVL